MTMRILLVSLLVVSSASGTVPRAVAATATPAVRLVEDYSLVYYRAGTTLDDQVDGTSEGAGPAFVDALGARVTGPAGTASVQSRGRNLAILGPGTAPALLEIDAVTSIGASATADTEEEGTPYADAWSVYTADFTVTTAVAFTLDVDIAASSTDTNTCTYVDVQLTGPGQAGYQRIVGVGADGCDSDDEEVGSLSGSLAPGEYRLVLEATGEVVGSSAAASMSARAEANLQLGRGCDNDPSTSGGSVQGTAGRDVLCGGLGRDVIEGGGGADLILAGPGNDEVRAGAGDDAVYGQDGNDRLDGGDGSDMLAGELGADHVTGGSGHDAIDGGLGSDEISGGYGADKINGRGGADSVAAGRGDDVVRACDNTKDVLSGQTGVDKVYRDRGDVITGFERRTAC